MIHTAKKLVYKAFGLSILSEIPMSELPQMSVQEKPADVVIEIADLSKVWSDLAVKKGNFICTKKLSLFRVDHTAIFLVQEGNKVIISPMNGSDEDQIRLYILGTCMGVLLMQRKILPLHGSAVAINGKAYAFIGDSGVGKSTLASAFLAGGYEFLSDDVIAVPLSQDGNIPFVIPAYPQQKLWQESLKEFGMETSHYRPIFERETKYRVPVPSQFSSEPLPLAGVFELVKTEQEGIGIHRVQGLEQLHTLFVHTYRNILIPHFGLLEWHFRTTTILTNQIDVFQVRRPASGFSGHLLVDSILSIINKGD